MKQELRDCLCNSIKCMTLFNLLLQTNPKFKQPTQPEWLQGSQLTLQMLLKHLQRQNGLPALNLQQQNRWPPDAMLANPFGAATCSTPSAASATSLATLAAMAACVAGEVQNCVVTGTASNLTCNTSSQCSQSGKACS